MTSTLDLVAEELGPLARRDVSIGELTTYRVGGSAAIFVEAGSVQDLHLVAQALTDTDLPVLIIGKGSNLLVADRGFPGLALVLGEGFAGIEIEGTRVTAGGAAGLPVVARRTAKASLTGFEWAVGVPGSIGGAVRMNAGGHGSEMSACLRSIRVVDVAGGEDMRVPVDALDLGYRQSNISSTQIVVAAELELTLGDQATAEDEITEIVRWRRANQPGGHNAGSVFTNPVGDSAGRLIESAGAKGLRLGTAEVSPKHANFIQSDRDGSADDVVALMTEIRRLVCEDSGVVLVPETRLVGLALPPLETSR